jgi:ATP-dependent RNA helicase HelY
VLTKRDLLPVIWFVFSRNGCDEAATALARDDVRLTSSDEAKRIRIIADQRLATLEASDVAVLDAAGWLSNLERGIAAHHAGLVPAFKETIEQCFAEGLVRVVFATETLALGVNLPARSVVVDKLTKFTGEHHEALTPGQFTQLTGRAGRRGLDERGHAIVPWSPFTTFAQVAALAGSRSFRLRSAFRPTYNMAVNLLKRLDAESVRRLLGRSFAQYQADVSVSLTQQRLVRERQRLASLEAHVGNGQDPDPTDSDLRDPEMIADAVSRLRPGDVVVAENGDRLAVLGVSWRRGGRARLRLIDPGGHDVRWELADLSSPPHTVGHIELPVPMAPDQPRFRGEVTGALRRVRTATTPARVRRRERRTAEPAEQLRRTATEIRDLESKARNDESSITRRFDAVAAVLRERGHLDEWNVTESGELVAGLYHELDLLVAEALTAGLLDDLDPSTLASVVSTFTYEHRSPTPAPPVWFPSKIGRVRFDAIERLGSEIRRAERRHGVPETRHPDPGFAVVARGWAAGEDLSALLDDELSAGDFVRNVKQLIDLLRQMAAIAPVAATRSSAAAAADGLHRGVVALSGTVGQ